MKMDYGVFLKVSALRSVLVVSGLMGFAGVALSDEVELTPADAVTISDSDVGAEGTSLNASESSVVESTVAPVAKTTKKAIVAAKVAKAAVVRAVATTVASAVASTAAAVVESSATLPAATATMAAESSPEKVEEISNGTPITLDGNVSITPILGWKIDRKGLGMGLVMKEVLPTQAEPVDYAKPIFARNITMMTLPEARPMDATSIGEIKDQISHMIARQAGLTDFVFTDAKPFDYKGKNDGLVLFSQLTVNNYQMMQMQIVVSGEKKAYLLTYSDLAANFANPETYDAAWKAMTSIAVEGVAPIRFEKEVTVGITALSIVIVLVAPFIFLRWLSARRIRKLSAELQYDWDHGAMKSDADYELSDIRSFAATRPAKKMGKKKNKSFGDIDVSSISSFHSCASSYN